MIEVVSVSYKPNELYEHFDKYKTMQDFVCFVMNSIVKEHSDRIIVAKPDDTNIAFIDSFGERVEIELIKDNNTIVFSNGKYTNNKPVCKDKGLEAVKYFYNEKKRLSYKESPAYKWVYKVLYREFRGATKEKNWWEKKVLATFDTMEEAREYMLKCVRQSEYYWDISFEKKKQSDGGIRQAPFTFYNNMVRLDGFNYPDIRWEIHQVDRKKNFLQESDGKWW